MDKKRTDSRGAKMLGLLGIRLQTELNEDNANAISNNIMPHSSGICNISQDKSIADNSKMQQLEGYNVDNYKTMDIDSVEGDNADIVRNDGSESTDGKESKVNKTFFEEKQKVQYEKIVVTDGKCSEELLNQIEENLNRIEEKENKNLEEKTSFIEEEIGSEKETSSEEEPFSSDDSVADPNYLSTSTSSSSSEERALLIEPQTALQEINEGNEIKKKSRKRKAVASEWKRNKAKFLRNSGQAYSTLKKGKHVEAKAIKTPCNETCSLRCATKFSEQERAAIFRKYWDFADIAKQRAFIVTLIQEISPKYSYPILVDGRRKRNNNNAFFFAKDDKKVRVCKVFFVSTLGITNRCLRSVISKRKEGDFEDKRGKHGKQNRMPEIVKNDVRAHIASIPKVESHYTRAHSEKEYIEGGKTITDLHRDYKNLCEAEGKPFASFTTYRNIFNYEFNLAFFVPKKDQCQKCVAYENANDEEKKEMEEDYLTHQREKKLSREEKQRDKEKINENYQASCFDLQATLPTPKGDVNTFYYKSKLSTYNFTVCDLTEKGQGSVTCFMWHEGQGKRGANEIGTCLLKYLKQKSDAYKGDDLEIVFFSDNCAGQQKNKFVLAVYFYAIAKYNFKSITHKYLVTGHTQNEGDNVHSVIEKNIKRSLKSGPIYTPDQYVMLVQTAKKTGTPYTVMQLSYDDFYDLKKLTIQTCFNFNKDTSGDNVKFSDGAIFKIERENLGQFYYKTSYTDIEYKAVSVKPRSTRTGTTFHNVRLESAYDAPLPIPIKKHSD